MDNTQLNNMTGGDIIGSDDIDGVKYQRVKLIQGVEGVNDGDVAESQPLQAHDHFLSQWLRRLTMVIANPPWVDKSANQLRAQVTGSISTVTTVTTVTGVTNLGGYPAQQPVIDANRSAWALMVRARMA